MKIRMITQAETSELDDAARFSPSPAGVGEGRDEGAGVSRSLPAPDEGSPAPETAAKLAPAQTENRAAAQDRSKRTADSADEDGFGGAPNTTREARVPPQEKDAPVPQPATFNVAEKLIGELTKQIAELKETIATTRPIEARTAATENEPLNRSRTSQRDVPANADFIANFDAGRQVETLARAAQVIKDLGLALQQNNDVIKSIADLNIGALVQDLKMAQQKLQAQLAALQSTGSH